MNEVKYTKDHEVVFIDGDLVSIGITAYAQDALGDLVFIELPEIGRSLDKGDDFAVVESVKTAAEVYSPIAGEITEVNTALESNLDLIKESVETGWIVKIKVSDSSALSELMDKDAYDAYLGTL